MLETIEYQLADYFISMQYPEMAKSEEDACKVSPDKPITRQLINVSEKKMSSTFSQLICLLFQIEAVLCYPLFICTALTF